MKPDAVNRLKRLVLIVVVNEEGLRDLSRNDLHLERLLLIQALLGNRRLQLASVYTTL